MKTTLTTVVLASAAVLLSACSTASRHSQVGVPASVQVPAGNVVAMQTVGAGDITYQCRVKKDMAGHFEWVFAGPDAVLSDRSGKAVGKYFGPPATWASNDGSKITGTQLAVSPGGTGNIPFQLVKANPSMGGGAMTGVTYVQRLATKGGVAPASACGADNVGAKEIVKYQANYLFWKAA